MSVTTTDNARITTVRQILADYELHQSDVNPQPEEHVPAPPPNPQATPAVSNPPDWDTEHRRVPPYRPIDPSLNNEERNTVNNNVERVFVSLMFGGVAAQARASHYWRATGEKVLGPKWFQYKIGGEW